MLVIPSKPNIERPASGASPYYGFGWCLDSGNETVWHSGLVPGFESLVTPAPSERAGGVVLFNTLLANLTLFQPDLGWVLIQGALFGVLWAVFRLGVAYSGESGWPDPRNPAGPELIAQVWARNIALSRE